MKKTSPVRHSHSPRDLRSRFSPRKKPVQERSQATVDAILQGASQVLVRVGYERANTTLIARAAGVSVGSLYQYFPNKDAVFSELLQYELARVVNAMAEALTQRVHRSLTECMRASISALIECKAKNPKLHIALKSELGRIDGSRALRRINEFALESTCALLTEHQTELPLRDPSQAAFFVVNMVEGIVSAALLERREALIQPGFAVALSDAVMGMLTAEVNSRGHDS